VLTFNYANFLAAYNVGSVGYSHAFGKNRENIFGIGVNYFDYGTMLGFDEYDNPTSNFTAKDINLNLMYARTLPKGFTVGGILKPIYSAYERYSSSGMALDLGAHYHNDSLGLSVGLTLKNVGVQFDPYDKVREKLAPNLLFGFSAKFKHAPIRLSLTLHNLQKWDLGYELASSDYEDNENKKIKWYNMLFRHMIISAEVMPTKNFFLSAAYNGRRGLEMKIKDVRTIAGFSFGAGLKISMFRVGFSLSQFQKGIMTYHVTLSTNLSEFGNNERTSKEPKELTEKQLQKQQEKLEKEQEKQRIEEEKQAQKELKKQQKEEEKQKKEQEKEEKFFNE